MSFGVIRFILAALSMQVGWRGVVHFFAQSSAVAPEVEGGRRRKGLRQEYPAPGRAMGCFSMACAVVVGATTPEG